MRLKSRLYADGAEWGLSGLNERLEAGEMVKKDRLYENIKTGLRVLVIWVSDELVTYLASESMTPVPVRKFIFMQDFKECEQ